MVLRLPAPLIGVPKKKKKRKLSWLDSSALVRKVKGEKYEVAPER